MKKILLITAALFSISTAAATSYQPSASECSTLDVDLLIDRVAVYFKKSATFPNPTETVYLKDGDTLTCPEFFASLSSNKTVITGRFAESAVRELFGVNIAFGSYYRYPTIRQDLVMFSIAVDYDGQVISNYKTITEKSVAPGQFYKYVSGYKINDSAINPLIYDGAVYPLPKLSDNDKLEIFSMPSEYNTWQKIVIDRKNKTLELYRTFEFPK